jgi:hypothetical protein
MGIYHQITRSHTFRLADKAKIFTALIFLLCIGDLSAEEIAWNKSADLQQMNFDLLASADRIIMLYDQYGDATIDEEKPLPPHMVSSLNPSIHSFIKDVKNAKTTLTTSIGSSNKAACEKALERFDDDIFNGYIQETGPGENGEVRYKYETIIKSMAVAQYFVLYTVKECLEQ